ncbi:hypothetical protein H0X32_03090 [Patescibacteria group bacterium]|nr:hypothetical protein [Patescibacteria group bacterium]
MSKRTREEAFVELKSRFSTLGFFSTGHDLSRERLVEVLCDVETRQPGRARQLTCFKLRWGFGSEEPMTYGQIGSHFGVSAERAQEMTNRAIGTLGHSSFR